MKHLITRCRISVYLPTYLPSFLVAVLIMLGSNKIWAQAGSTAQCNLIGNSEITYNNSLAITSQDPFTQNYVSGWVPIQTPQIDTQFASTPSAALMWAQNASPSMFEGIFQHLLPIEIGKPYIFSIKLRHQGGGSQVDIAKVLMTDGAYLLISGNPPLTAPQQPVLFVPSINHINFVQYTTCNFVPTQQWQYLVIHPEQFGTGATQWLSVDDVVLIPNFGFAGNDTLLCTPGLQIKLGNGACSGQFSATYEWYAVSNPTTILSTNSEYVFNASTTESYVLKRTIFNCDTYDTVNVEVKNLIAPDLGPDVVLCDSSEYMLQTPFNDSTWLLWEPQNIFTWETNTMRIYTSGHYKVTISKDGCSLKDSVNITMLPVLEVLPDTIRICGTDSVTFCATQGMASYNWSTGDTTRCITVYEAGRYRVEVTDTNGCVAENYGMLFRGSPFNVFLGTDREVCVGNCLVLTPQITGSSTISNFTYIWNTSETSQSICINSTGNYWVCVTDSLGCTSCDSVFVRIKQKTKPNVTNLGPICLYDMPFQILNGSPTGGFYTGKGVDNYGGISKFYPRAAGVGTHIITYTYTNDSGCTDTANFIITVIDGPYAELEDIQTCITHSLVNIPLHTQSTIPGTWSINANNGEFDPSAAGAGVHTVSYTITDTVTGCTYTAYAKVYVGQQFSASYSSTGPAGWQCEGKIVMHEATNGYRFLWENIATQEVISRTAIAGLQANGSYNLYVWDSIGNCPPGFTNINIDYTSCCEVTDPNQEALIEEFFEVLTDEPNSNNQYYVPKYIDMDISNKVWYFDKPIIVPREFTLNIIDCDFLMKSCTKILVENGAILNIQNSEIGYCGWQGIEAGGWYDCCQTQNFNCNLGNGCYSSSEVYVNNSKIHYADVAVMAGYKEDYTLLNCSSTNILKDVSGGAFVELTNSIFSRNYIDVLFREYDNELMHFDIEICGDKELNDVLNLSSITNCVFTLPATQQYCNSIGTGLQSRISAIGGKCHIVDLAETSNVSFFGMGQNLRGYLGYYSTVNFLSTGRLFLPAGIQNNTYSLPCSNLKLYK